MDQGKNQEHQLPRVRNRSCLERWGNFQSQVELRAGGWGLQWGSRGDPASEFRRPRRNTAAGAGKREGWGGWGHRVGGVGGIPRLCREASHCPLAAPTFEN